MFELHQAQQPKTYHLVKNPDQSKQYSDFFKIDIASMLAYLAESWDFSTLIHKIDCSLWFEILQRLIYNWQVTGIFRNSNILQYDV